MWRVLASAPVFWVLAVSAGCSSTSRFDSNKKAVEPQPAAPAVPAVAVPAAPATAEPDKPKAVALDELLLFFPTKFPAGNWKPKELRFEDVWFQADDEVRLHGWYCPCDKPRAILLYAHGNAGNVSDYAPLMKYFQENLRVSVLIFDYRGYGRSEGAPSVEGILKDARAARNFLAQRAKVKATDLVLMGRSLGGAVAVQLAAEAPARGLILESTFSSMRDVAAHLYPDLAWLVPANKLDSVSQISRYKGPLLQSHGNADRTIPYELGRKLFQSAREPKTFVELPGADHKSPGSAEYYKQLDRFLDGLPPAGKKE
jgi:fermentation-respiration switch protein FrsA (DUF1100 family)